QARAGLTFTLQEVGPDVVMTGSGTVNTAGFNNLSTWIAAANLIPQSAQFIVGGPGVQSGTSYSPISGPSTIGTSLGVDATSGTGDGFGLGGQAELLFLPDNYVSGSQLSGTATYAGQTLVSLGVTPEKTYTWTWGSGANADSAVLQVGPTAVPGPSSLVLLVAGLPALAAAARGRRR